MLNKKEMTMADALQIPEEDHYYTYADYLSWEGPERYQLINGEAFMMSSPSVAHQALLVELTLQFGNWLRGKPCQVLVAPMDVRLFFKKDNSDDTVLQPDLLVVCDKNKLGKNSVNEAPDLVLEILSPSTTDKELFLKFNSYLKAGVKEYWLINPDPATIHPPKRNSLPLPEKITQVHVYENGHYISNSYEGNVSIPVAVLPGLVINLDIEN
jgi:Uma2 family endonuclease